MTKTKNKARMLFAAALVALSLATASLGALSIFAGDCKQSPHPGC